VVKFTDMAESIHAIVLGDQVLGKFFTGMEIAEVVQLTNEKDMQKMRSIISKQFYQQFRVKMSTISNGNKTSLGVDSEDEID
jgi:hypothetical protein